MKNDSEYGFLGSLHPEAAKNTDNIRDVIAFPKTTSATSLMDDSPNYVDPVQLSELGINLEK